MVKYKYYICIILWTFMPKMSLAVDLELSDIIREARAAQIKQEKSQIQKNIQQIKSDMGNKKMINGEQCAIEKLNPEEIMKNVNREKMQ